MPIVHCRLHNVTLPEVRHADTSAFVSTLILNHLKQLYFNLCNASGFRIQNTEYMHVRSLIGCPTLVAPVNLQHSVVKRSGSVAQRHLPSSCAHLHVQENASRHVTSAEYIHTYSAELNGACPVCCCSTSIVSKGNEWRPRLNWPYVRRTNFIQTLKLQDTKPLYDWTVFLQRP